MKLAFFTLLTPEYSLTEVIPAARRWGFEGIVWRVLEPGTPVLGAVNYWSNNKCSIPPGQIGLVLPMLVRKAAEARLESPSICPYVTCLEPEKVEPLMAAMADAGVKGLRVSAPRYDKGRNYRAQFAAARKAYEQIAVLAKKHGVRAFVEQHHFNLTPSASACYRLVEGLDPEHVGVILDTGNVVVEGFEQFGLALDLLGEYLAEVHVKNGILVPAKTTVSGFQRFEIQWGPLDAGMVNLEPLMEKLQEMRYEGWLVLEDFSNRPTEVRMTEGVGMLRRIAGR